MSNIIYRISMAAGVALTVGSGCTTPAQEQIEETVILTVENRMGAELWYFQYTACGTEDWIEVIASDKFIADGSDVTSVDLAPGCYDIYVEDEFGCSSDNSSGNLAGGTEFTWTVVADDLTCPP